MHLISLHVFIARLKSCFSTSAFKNVHFLINQSCSRKNMRFLFLSAFDHFLYDTLAHCTVAPHCSFALSDVTLAPIHLNVLFLNKCCPFKNTSVNKTGTCRGPEGTRESPPIPEVRENLRVKCVTGTA